MDVSFKWLYLLEICLPQAHLLSYSDKDKATQERLVEPLMSLVKSYEGGRESHARVIVQSLFEEYLSLEELFNDNYQVWLQTIHFPLLSSVDYCIF